MATEPLSSFTGLASGLDFRSLTDQIIAAERRPAARLEKQVEAGNKRRAALDTYRGLLTGLQDAAKKLKDRTAVNVFGVTVAGTDTAGKPLLAATAGDAAAPGTYTVEVTRLTRAQRTLSNTVASAATALNYRGSFTVGSRQVDVVAADTLTTLRDKINALNTGASPTRVTASVEQISGTQARLVLKADAAGTPGAFAVTDTQAYNALTGTGGVAQRLGLGGAPDEPALDAQVTVDGTTFTRASNTLTDVIPGVTLSLANAEAGRTASITVVRDTAKAEAALKEFVDAYNKVGAFVRQQRTPAANGTLPALAADSGVRGVRSRMSAVLLGKAATATGEARHLAAVGLNLDRQGALALDAAKFQTALAADAADLGSLLADRGSAFVASLDADLAAGTGTLDRQKSGIEARVTAMGNRITDIDARLEKRRAALIAQFSRFEGALGRLKAIGDQMSAQFAGLNKSSDN